LIPDTGADAQFARGTRAWLDRIDRVSAGAFRTAHKELRQAIANSRAMIRQQRPDIVILGGDNPGYTTPGLIEGAHREGVAAVLVPSTMSNGLGEAEVFSSDPRYHVDRTSARLVSQLFPHWTTLHKGLELLRLPPGHALALEALGIAPP